MTMTESTEPKSSDASNLQLETWPIGRLVPSAGPSPSWIARRRRRHVRARGGHADDRDGGQGQQPAAQARLRRRRVAGRCGRGARL